jgi:hypothetical protein
MSEDLVLNGSFEAIFDTKQVHFNPGTGSFLIEYKTQKTLYYEGDNITVFWTMRALAREGYRMIQDDKVHQRLILSDDSPRWSYQDGEKLNVFEKLSELVHFLRSFSN